MLGHLNVKAATRIYFTPITEHQKIKVSKVVHTIKLFHGKICGSHTFLCTYSPVVTAFIPYIHVGRYRPL